MIKCLMVTTMSAAYSKFLYLTHGKLVTNSLITTTSQLTTLEQHFGSLFLQSPNSENHLYVVNLQIYISRSDFTPDPQFTYIIIFSTLLLGCQTNTKVLIPPTTPTPAPPKKRNNRKQPCSTYIFPILLNIWQPYLSSYSVLRSCNHHQFLAFSHIPKLTIKKYCQLSFQNISRTQVFLTTSAATTWFKLPPP